MRSWQMQPTRATVTWAINLDPYEFIVELDQVLELPDGPAITREVSSEWSY